MLLRSGGPLLLIHYCHESHGNLYNLVEFCYTDSQVAFSQSLNRLILFVVLLYLIYRHTFQISHRVQRIVKEIDIMCLDGVVYGPMCVPGVP